MAILKSILNLLKLHRRSGKASGTGETRAVIIPREKNPIRKSDISQNAVRVLRVLNDAGYEAYLVGGGIRDLILGRHPKDFDVTTNATPEQVKRLFRNCRIIGRRFKIVHVVFAEEIIEVATFRGRGGDEDEEKGKRAERNGMLVRDNLYGTLEEDADRRDFTINSVYWSAKDGSLRDFHNGLRDMREGRIDIIGDPDRRYHEDPVRMLRAVRFAAKLGMTITERTDEPIYALSHLLDEIAPARLFEEVLKLFVYGHAVRSLEELRKHHLFKELFPAVDALLDGPDGGNYEKFLNEVCASTDKRIQGGKPVTATFMYASLMWPAFIAIWDFPETPDLVGLRITVPCSTKQENVTGFDVGLWGRSEYFEGVQLNVLRNDVRDSCAGIQVGCYNSVARGDLFGIQAGLWNESMSHRGVQFGLINVSGDSQGLQIGLINRSETMYGFQLGLVNIIRDAEFQFMPILNVGF